MERGLPGRVPAADDVDVLAGERLRLRHRRAVVDAGALQVDAARGLEPSVLDTESEDDGSSGDLRPAVGGSHDEASLVALERDDSASDLRPGAEEPRLLVGALGELPASEPAGKAEVVADQGARARLPADAAAVEHGRPEPLRGPVDRRAQAGRARPDDDEVGVVCLELDREPAGQRELGRRRVDEDGAVRERDRRYGVLAPAATTMWGMPRPASVDCSSWARRERGSASTFAPAGPSPFIRADSCKSSEIVRWKTSSGVRVGRST